MKKRFTEAPTVGFVREIDAGIPVNELCRTRVPGWLLPPDGCHAHRCQPCSAPWVLFRSMGYYIDYVFPAHATRETVIVALESAGAVPVPAHLQGPKPRTEYWYPARLELPQPWIRGARGILVLASDQVPARPGNWASTRLSWASSRQDVRETVALVIRLATAVGGRVFDGQLGSFIDRADWESRVLDRFASSARTIAGMTGVVDTGDAPSPTPVTLSHPGDDPWSWTIRTGRCLEAAGITTLEQLSGRTATELGGIRNFGQKSLREVRDRLALYGLTLAGDADVADP